MGPRDADGLNASALLRSQWVHQLLAGTNVSTPLVLEQTGEVQIVDATLQMIHLINIVRRVRERTTAAASFPVL